MVQNIKIDKMIFSRVNQCNKVIEISVSRQIGKSFAVVQSGSI